MLGRLGVRPRLVALACAAAAPFVVLTVSRAYRHADEARHAAEVRARETARALAGRVLDRGNAVRSLLVAVTHFVRPDSSDTTVNDRLLLAVKRALPQAPVTNLWLAAPDGRIIGTSRRPAPTGMVIGDRAYFREVLRTRRSVYGEAQHGRSDGAWTVSVAEPVLDPAGSVRAVVVGSIRLDELARSLTAMPLPPRAEATLVDARGHVLATVGGDAAAVGQPATRLATVVRAGADEGTGHLAAQGGTGRRLVGYSTVRPLGWRVFVSVDEATALAPIRRGVLEEAMLGLAALLAAVGLAGAMARRFAMPIDALAADAQALAGGDFTRRSDARAPGELGTLAAAFNDMAATIAARTAALHRSEHRYRMLFDASPLPMYLVDLTTYEFLAVNDACVAQYGWTHEEFARQTLLDIRPAEDRLKFLAVAHTLARALGPDDRVNAGVWRHLRKDGTTFEAEVFTALTEYEGRAARLSVVADVTARRTAERALQESQEQLRRAQKMEAVGRFAGGIAHDFNNLLTGILVYCELALADLRDDEGSSALRARDDFQSIREAAHRAATLTTQILAFTRGQVVQPVAIDPLEVVGALEPMLRRMIGEDVRLVVDAAPLSGVVLADRGQLEQVVMNLALNARDAMPDGGTLTLALDEIAAEPLDAAHPGIAPGRWVRLAVRDTGVGMDAETQARIFEPFFTTKSRGHGTGLGLATVYGIVQQSGGTVRVTSAPGEGSTFTVYLPHVGEDAGTTTDGWMLAPPEAPVRDGHETVLVAEDEPLVRAVTREILTRRGYTVLTAEDGPAAIAAARHHAGHIHLLVTDVVMPGMSGPELAVLMASERPELRVLFTSGYADHEVLGRGVSTDRMAFVPKPFTPEAFGRRVREVLDSTATESVAAA
ncbi:MAG TPA: ATP-binding protein [Gemmatirosa sp.]|nr:ATP-binding protein [Gemmatirosa sp.]